MTPLFLLVTALYLYRTISITAVFYKLNESVSGGHTPDFILLKYFPHFLILPILFSLATLLFFYCSLKIRDMSPLAWLLAFIVSLTVPPSLSIIGSNTVGATGLIHLNTAIADPTVILGVMAIIVLVYRRKKFNKEGAPIKLKYRIFLLLFFLCVTFPLIMYAGYAKYRISTNDFEYKKIHSEVPFRPLQPTYFPANRTFESNYYISKQKLIPSQKTVQLHLNYPLTDLLKGKKSGLIVVQQSKFDSSFNYEQFKKTETATDEAKIVSVTLALNKEATIITRQKEYTLIFITRENVLVRIRAYYIAEAELIKFASGLN